MSPAGETFAQLAVRRRPDAHVVERALSGDPVAFSELYRRYSSRVYAFCLARLLSPDAAQDATQEVFVRFLSADRSSIRSVPSWLFGVARHVCIDISASRQRLEPSGHTAGAEEETFSAEDSALSNAEAADVLLALRRMRPRYRTALVMREVHGQPVSEIAEAFSISTGTAYTLLSRARDSFGRVYAHTRQLPPLCRESVELLYRRSGTGINQAEAERLDTHLASCPRCSRETRLAEDRPLFRGLLPLLWPRTGESPGLLARAVLRLGSAAPSLGAAAPVAPELVSSLPILAGVAIVSVVLAIVIPAGSAGLRASASVGVRSATVAAGAADASAAGGAPLDDPRRDPAFVRQLHLPNAGLEDAGDPGAIDEGAAGAGRAAGSGAGQRDGAGTAAPQAGHGPPPSGTTGGTGSPGAGETGRSAGAAPNGGGNAPGADGDDTGAGTGAPGGDGTGAGAGDPGTGGDQTGDSGSPATPAPGDPGSEDQLHAGDGESPRPLQ